MSQTISVAQFGNIQDLCMFLSFHIWVLNSVIHDVLTRNGASPIDLQILDIKQCFDGVWSEEYQSDNFQYGVQDNTINLLYDASQNIQLAIRTPIGITKRENVAKTVMQGDVWVLVRTVSYHTPSQRFL